MQRGLSKRQSFSCGCSHRAVSAANYILLQHFIVNLSFSKRFNGCHTSCNRSLGCAAWRVDRCKGANDPTAAVRRDHQLRDLLTASVRPGCSSFGTISFWVQHGSHARETPASILPARYNRNRVVVLVLVRETDQQIQEALSVRSENLDRPSIRSKSAA